MKLANAILNLVILLANVYFFFYYFGRIVNDRYNDLHLVGITLSFVVIISSSLLIQNAIRKES